MNRARATRSWSLVVEPDASSGRVCALLSAVVLFGTLLTISSCASRDHAIANLEGNSIRAEKIAEVERFRSEQLIDP
ncbi:MAG: hypothetical protein HRU16_08930, partial [Planctomycetes bacterium]|nr:hypothetical protein [Planctomycetota bacterium]